MKTGFLVIVWLCGLLASLVYASSYKHEVITMPPSPHQTKEIDGMCFTPKGDLAICLPSGEVWKYDVKTNVWSLFAEGLHNPMGILALSEFDFVVSQRPELTRIRDLNGDGKADDYQCLTDVFGLSGNYHEFNFTPVMDTNGDIYFSLGTASNGAGIRQIVRSRYDKRARKGRMFSCVPFRGWVMKYSVNGETHPWSCGLRTPNGLGFNLQGDLFVSDNQGDWVGTSKIYHVKPGRFFGHVPSLNWHPRFFGKAFTLKTKKLDKLRTRAAVLLPHGVVSNSPTKIVVDHTKGKFGPFAGQLFVGEMNWHHLLRVVLEKVDGEYQGAAIPFYSNKDFRLGSNRLAFSNDGHLFVGHSKHTWTGGEGLTKISYTGKKPFEIQKVSLLEHGFKLLFTSPVDHALASQKKYYRCKRYWYDYHQNYGSAQYETTEVAIRGLHVNRESTEVMVYLNEMKAWTIHELELMDFYSYDGIKLMNNKVYYTLNRLLKRTPPPPRQWNMNLVKKKKAKKSAKKISEDDSRKKNETEKKKKEKSNQEKSRESEEIKKGIGKN